MKKTTFAFFISLILCILFKIRVTGTFICRPAEENKSYTLMFEFKVNARVNEIIYIQEHGSHVGNCSTLKWACSNSFPEHISVNLTERNEYAYVTLTIANVSRNEYRQEWMYSAFIGTPLSATRQDCVLKFFYKADVDVCTSNASRSAINVICTSQKLYPAGRCHFKFIKPNNMSIESSSVSAFNVIQENHTYFRSTCSLQLPFSSLIPGSYILDATIYPNITGNDSDVDYGTRASHIFVIEIPRVTITGCPREVEEGAELNCVCEIQNYDKADVNISWLDADGNLVQISHLLTLLAQADKSNTAYICQATHISGWKSEGAFYKLKIIPHNNVLSGVLGAFGGAVLLAIICVLLYFFYTKKVVIWTPNALKTSEALPEKCSSEGCDDPMYEYITYK